MFDLDEKLIIKYKFNIHKKRYKNYNRIEDL